MSCSKYWKKLFSFAFTFSFGIISATIFQEEMLFSGFHIPQPIKKVANQERSIDFVERHNSNSFASAEIPSIKQGNCIPADRDLKYHFLSKTEGNKISIDKLNEKSEKKINFNRKLSTKREEYLKPGIKELEKQISQSTKNNLQTQNLLHKEKCYESDGRK